ncbi:MAG: cobaltochelatase subunit CobN, partial [Coleofasciculus sp. Co-bin14]|nr:cobaltochelatase subunit CobN [Coleofasciculus sp. Co-bin14]
MHRIAATPGGWNPQSEGVIFVEQTPAPIVFLTAADTDIQTLAASTSQLPAGFPALRVVNLLHLQQQLTIDTYAENVLVSAQIIILRLLGGRSYWSYGLEVIRETVQQTGAALVVLPGDDRPDPDLISHSTVTLTAVNQLWRYFTEGGVENFVNALKLIADVCLGQTYNPPPPQPVPRVGLYSWKVGSGEWGVGSGEKDYGDVSTKVSTSPRLPLFTSSSQSPFPKVGILFYRAHYLAGNIAPIEALCQALADRQLEPIPVFVSSLRDADVQAELLLYFQPKEAEAIKLLLNTTSFSLAKLDTETPQLELWQRLDVPVLQVILSGGTVEQWNAQFQGLTPRDTAMNVALPEVDGRIISR